MLTLVAMRPTPNPSRLPMPLAPANPTVSPEARGYFAARRGRVEAFVARHLTWPGTFALHRAAFGRDILRAPVNLVLSPALVGLRGAAWASARLRLHRLAGWFASRPVLMRSAVSARLEAALLAELLDVPLPETGLHDRAALAQAIFAAPALRAMLDRHADGGRAGAERMMQALGEYAGTRAAVAELTTALLTLALGAALFQGLTPGMISMAPGLAEAVSHETAVADFPLGSALGGLWYGVFPAAPSPGTVAISLAALVGLGSVITAFAGVLADPVQAWLGIHRRRLLRLLDTLESELGGAQDRPFVAREHFLVRLFDLWDAALSLLRVLKG